jgi:pyroglutamyl-peptidase
LAQSTKHLRIETCARNVLSRVHADTQGRLPGDNAIAAAGPSVKKLRAPVRRLLAAASVAGLRAALSHDAGSYLCNYLCWRVSEAASAAPRGPRLIAFVHVPQVRPSLLPSARSHRLPRTLGDLVVAGEAILRAAIDGVRGR